MNTPLTLDAIREIVKEAIDLVELPDPTFTIVSLGADELDTLEVIMTVEGNYDIEIADGAISDDYTCHEMFAVATKLVEANND